MNPRQLSFQIAAAARARDLAEWDEEHDNCGRCGRYKPNGDERQSVPSVGWCDCSQMRLDFNS